MSTKNGDLKKVAFFGAGSKYPSLAAGVHHANSATYNSTITATTTSDKFWHMMPLIKRTNVPDKEKWVDYISVRNYNNTSNLWIASASLYRVVILRNL